MEYDIDKLVSEMDFEKNMHKLINKILLTSNQIEILDKYNIKYKDCSTLSELLFNIDEYLEEQDDNTELEKIADEIAETNYYMNTNK